MSDAGSEPGIVVSRDSFVSDDPYALVAANIEFVNDLMENYFRPEELPTDALRSYYVDFFSAQVDNGGFSQFVYNCSWDERAIRYVREGLAAMGASRHLELFDQSAAIVERLGTEGLERFFESDLFGENPARDALDEHSDRFHEVSKSDDLTRRNSNWLRSLPSLVVLTAEEREAEIERRAAALPDREARAAEAREEEDDFMGQIRALCAAAGQELEAVTAGDPSHVHNGTSVLAWHFLTDQGHHYMVEADGQAMMFHGDTGEQIASIPA